MKAHSVCRGRYVRFSIREDRLRIFLLPDGRAFLREERRFENNDLRLFRGLIEDFLCNGWTEVFPEAVGDLRDDAWLVISDDYTFADPNADDRLLVGTAFGYADYWRDSYVDPLIRRGYVDFSKHVYLTPQELDFEVARCRPDLFDSEVERERLLVLAQRYWDFKAAKQAGQICLLF